MATRDEKRTRKDASARCRTCGAKAIRIGSDAGTSWLQCAGGCGFADYVCDCPTLARARARIAGEG